MNAMGRKKRKGGWLTAPLHNFLLNNNSSNVVRHVHDRRRPCRIDLPPFNGYDAIIRASRWQCQRSRRKLLFMPLPWFRYASSRTLHACTDVHQGHYARMILLFHRLECERSISRSKEPTFSFRIDLDLVLIRRDNSKMAGNGQMIRVKRIEFMIVKMIGTGSCDCASLEYGNVRVWETSLTGQ